MPLPPPVISATFPSSLPMVALLYRDGLNDDRHGIDIKCRSSYILSRGWFVETLAIWNLLAPASKMEATTNTWP